MAKAVGPLFSVEARGRAGPLVANTSRGNKYIKSQVAPSQPRTARQLWIRSLALTYVRLWQTLSDAQRLTWRDYADEHKESDWTGTQRRLSGLNWYVRCNVRLADAGQAAITDAPEEAAPGAVTGFAITQVTADIKAAWTTPTGNGVQVDIWIDGPHSAGRAGSQTRSRHLVYKAAETTTPVVVVTGAADGVYHFYARVIDETTGLASLFVSDDLVFVTA